MASASGFIHPLFSLRETRCKRLLTVLFCMLVCTLGFHTGVSAFAPGAGHPPGVPDLTHPDSKLTIVKNNSVANNIDQNIVKAHVVDEFGNPVAGVDIVIVSSSGGFTPIYTTNASGDANVPFPSLIVGTVSIQAYVNGDPFIHGSPAVTYFVAAPPTVNTPTTRLSVLTTNAIANNSATNSVRAHITDAYGHPIAGQTIAFSIASGIASFVGPSSLTTDANGNADISLISTIAGNVNITATMNGINIPNGSPATVTFVADVPQTNNPLTALSVVTNNAVANGIATNSVKAHVVDANGNIVANQPVVFTIFSGTANFVGSTTVNTDASGNAVIALNSTVAGNVKITARVNGVFIIYGSPANVTFTAGPPDVTAASTGLLVITNNAIANGAATNSVRARIRDINGNAVANATVVFNILSGTGTIVGSSTVTTNASGFADINITSLVAGNVSITATVNGVPLVNGSPAVVRFVADAPAVANPGTALSVVTNNALANGAATNRVKAHIVDANGNPVANATIVFTIASGTANFAIPASTTTNASGDAFVNLNSNLAGNVTITATVNGVAIVNGSPLTITFVADAPAVNNPATALSVVTNNAVANNTATNSVKAHIVDASGNPVPNATVVFNIFSGTATFASPATVTTNASGDAIVTLKSNVVGSVRITATVNGVTILNGSPAIVVFVVDVPSVTNPATALSVVTNNAVANNIATNSVKAHIVDAGGNPVPNATIVFTIATGTATFASPATVTTNASGDAVVTLKSTVAGSVTITATVNGTPITNGSPATVIFVADVPSIANPATALSVVQNDALANNTATNSVKAHIADAQGNPVANATVLFYIYSGTATFASPASVTTDANGNATVTLKSNVVGSVNITATVNGTVILNGSPAIVRFVVDVPAVTNPATALSVVTNNAIANGTATNSVKAHIVDANGNPVPNATIVFTIASGAANFASPASVTTNASGDAVVTLNSTIVGSVDITATVNGTPIVNGSPATVNFVVDVPAVTNPATKLTVVLNYAVANGFAVNSVKAHIEDAQGNPVPNALIRFIRANGTATFTSPPLITTDLDGDATVTLSSTVVGAVDITATVNGVAIVNGSPATVFFVADVPAVTNPATALSVVTDNAIANNTATNSVKAHIADANGNPVPNATVVFTIATGTATFTSPVTVTTDANGDAVVALKSGVVGTVTITATVEGTPIVNGSPVAVKFVADVPAIANPATALSVVTNNALANNTATNSVKAHIADASGNPVANATVVFHIYSGTATFASPATVTTDVNGDAIVTLTSTVAGSVNITATVNGNVILNGSPAIVIFKADAPATGNPATALSVVDDNRVANNTALNSVKAHIADANGNPVQGASIVFIITGGTAATAAFTDVNPILTDASGNAIMHLKSPVTGTVIITATVNGNPITNGSPVTVTFVADVPSVGNPATALTVVDNNRVANNAALNSVKAHIVDAGGNPVPGAAIIFTITGGTATTAAFTDANPITTDANGDAIMHIKSPLVGTVIITATVNGNPITNGSPATVIFVADIPVVGNPATALSVVDDNRVANNTALNSVKAHIVDGNGNPVPGAIIVFTITGGTASSGATLNDANPITTDANGDAIMHLKSTAAGTVTITATVNGVAITNGSPATVTFVADVPSGANPATALSVVIPSAVANGTAVTSVKAHVADANGNPVKGAAVQFTIATGAANIVETNPVITDANGDAVITLNSTVVGAVTITATAGGTPITNGSPATVTFTVDVPAVTNPATALSVVVTGVVADGVALNKVKAHIEDAQGNPVPGATIEFTIATGTAQFDGPATMTTDANGDAIISLKSTVAGTVTVTAKVNGTAIVNGSPAIVTFVAGPPDPGNTATALIVATNNALANGTATNSVKAHVVDANGNPVPNATIEFAIAGGTGAFVGSTTITTDANGDATITLTSTVAGTVDITATVNGVAIINNSPATVTFTTEPDVNIADTRLIVLSNDAIADGVETNSVKAHVVDATGTPLNLKEVFFKIESGDATVLTIQPVLTDANGDATILLASKTAGAVSVTAKVGDKQIINGSPAKLRFVPIDIYVPKIFTPNNDGQNDIVKPIVVGITTFHYFNIYNRWGNLVFTTKDPNVGWDGRFKGVLQPVETYMWIAEGLDKDKKKITRRGMISLVR
ncbi:hypothetical protein D3H65_28960 [Paraflavitalea soli]|uniref:Big-1 domain-containing protein n=2 Tax=Paraflavitalea soli TaxID=2315862 RepID=A0A3B7MX25_9BACT|nr:hypothetical protein D3H65_28960 [Paraflavitalea soli]